MAERHVIKCEECVARQRQRVERLTATGSGLTKEAARLLQQFETTCASGHLVRHDPARNMHRFYAIYLVGNLFGGWALLREWGRVGSPGRVRVEAFADEAAAAAVMAWLERRKRRRGYAASTASP